MSQYVKIEEEDFNEEEYNKLVEYWTGTPPVEDTSLPGGMTLRKRKLHDSRISKYERYITHISK